MSQGLIGWFHSRNLDGPAVALVLKCVADAESRT
jgi:hypothetical protein